MSKDNSNQNNGSEGNNSEGNQSQENQDKGNVKTIPYERFKEINDKLKEASDKLSAIDAEKKKQSDDKLLEEKKYQDLLGNKDKEIADLKTHVAKVEKNAKIGEIKNKFINSLSKVDVIDAEDAIKLVGIDDLIDSEDLDTEINKRVTDLTKNKSYLFKAGSNRSNHKENNGVKNNGGSDDKKELKGTNAIIASLSAKLNS